MTGLISSCGQASIASNPEARSTTMVLMTCFNRRTRTFIHSSFAIVALLGLSFGDVGSWIMIKKPVRYQPETGRVDCHDRPLFRARDMGSAARVPDHNVAIVE